MADAADEEFTLIPEPTVEKTREELLTNFIEIPRDKWEDFIAGMQIRLEGTDGKLRTGGYIVGIMSVGDGDVQSKVFRVSNFPKRAARQPNYKEFNFKWSDITRVWKRIDRFSYFEMLRAQAAIKALAEQVVILQRANEAFEARNAKLERKTAALEAAISKIIAGLRR